MLLLYLWAISWQKYQDFPKQSRIWKMIKRYWISPNNEYKHCIEIWQWHLIKYVWEWVARPSCSCSCICYWMIHNETLLSRGVGTINTHTHRERERETTFTESQIVHKKWSTNQRNQQIHAHAHDWSKQNHASLYQAQTFSMQHGNAEWASSGLEWASGDKTVHTLSLD